MALISNSHICPRLVAILSLHIYSAHRTYYKPPLNEGGKKKKKNWPVFKFNYQPSVSVLIREQNSIDLHYN